MEEVKKITGQVLIPQKVSALLQEEVKHILRYKEKIEESFSKTVTKILEIILAGAFFLEVSDVHIEPEKENARLRIRIDGVLHDVLDFDLKTYKVLLSRVKLLAGLKLNITTRPQDGRFSILIERDSIEVRASSLPAEYGESIVLRILNPKWVVILEKLGLRRDMLKLFEKEIKKPHGMIVCTGPTGCGKTTTLYAFLKKKSIIRGLKLLLLKTLLNII